MKLENKHLTADFGIFHNISDDSYRRGMAAENDRFWDAYQQAGSRTNYDHAFGGEGWTAENLKPRYDMKPTTGYMMFRYCPAEVDLAQLLEERGITFDISKCVDTTAMFFYSHFTRLPALDFSSLRKQNAVECFSYCHQLKTIDKLIVSDKQFNSSTFVYCKALENIIFEGTVYGALSFAYSPLLTDTSVQSIIDALKDLTGAASNTLTFHPDVGAKLTGVQKAAITAKNWTLVY